METERFVPESERDGVESSKELKDSLERILEALNTTPNIEKGEGV